jgi:hypothetical protein
MTCCLRIIESVYQFYVRRTRGGCVTQEESGHGAAGANPIDIILAGGDKTICIIVVTSGRLLISDHPRFEEATNQDLKKIHGEL